VNAYALTTVGQVGTTIYIVDAFHYPTALADFNTFSAQFGLPQETSANALSSTNKVFQVIYANGHKPRTNCGWAQEAALDIEWAHAMAPQAKIVLVEAASNTFKDLLAAVDVASGRSDAREVSMSWGGSEFSSEKTYDSHFNHPGNQIVYVASSGDIGGQNNYPGVSPFVVSAGGTTLNVDLVGNRISESGWNGSGGGPSAYEPRPVYQDKISAIVGSKRGVPDWSFDADPYTGVSVYDSTSCQGAVGWLVFGGTSVAAPAIAGIINSAGNNTDSTAELSLIYSNLGSTNFFDILTGAAGAFAAKSGWDFVTGIGSTAGMNGK
jgi:subtilase family serine protease